MQYKTVHGKRAEITLGPFRFAALRPAHDVAFPLIPLYESIPHSLLREHRYEEASGQLVWNLVAPCHVIMLEADPVLVGASARAMCLCINV